MNIKLVRYFGDKCVTKSRFEVWMDGEDVPRMMCEAREPKFKDYEETFAGASKFCLPIGKWKMKVGNSPYGAMGLRVPKCSGHRQVFIGHKWSRQWMEGEILIGKPVMPREWNSEEWGNNPEAREAWENKHRRIEDGEEVYRELTQLVYEAYRKDEEFWIEIENKTEIIDKK